MLSQSLLQIVRLAGLLSLLILSPTQASPPGPGGWFGKSDDESRKWSSMLDVDPSKIIQLMAKHGGLLMPESSKKELEVFAKVCHADKVKLNVLQRKLEIKNFVVQLPGEEEALRIGRVYLYWDSYLKPCVEIAVDDVSILVEFFNVVLTKNNWNVLKKNGFPPELPEEDPKKFGKSSSSSSFVRIGSIDLSGNVVALLKSRPLKKNLAEVKFALDTFDTLDDQIKAQSLENLANTGKRGCTTEELYSLIQAYVGGILKQVLADTFDDVTGGGTKTSDSVDRVVKLTKKSVSKYFNDAGEWTGEQVQNKLAERLQRWGASNDQSKQAASILAARLQQSSESLLSKNEKLQNIYKKTSFFKKQDNAEEK